MRPVTVAANAVDTCDPAPACQIVSVESNEPIDGLGDGDTAPDWEITGDMSVSLRSERSGTGDGREYTITVQCTGASGNTNAADTIVFVPHGEDEEEEIEEEEEVEQEEKN